MQLEDELTGCGYVGDAESFRDIVEATFIDLYSELTDEELACEPREAIRFCGMVRYMAECETIPYDLILRTLFNTRKRSQQTRDPLKRDRSPMILAKELAACNCPIGREQFTELVVAMFHGHCRAWTDEELLTHPVESLGFCDSVRQASRATHLSDMVILRALTNLRKAGRLDRETAAAC